MTAEDALLFIDANKYLDLYRIPSGKKLLGPLVEQVDRIFITQQVVAEVQRNKIAVAAEFLNRHFKDLKVETFNVPDHLSGTSDGQDQQIRTQMSEIQKQIKQVNDEIDGLKQGIMEQISQSKDEVSVALGPIFGKAVAHTDDELQRARSRKELGNPPGKSSDAIGDQLTWEQILSQFKGKKRIWIISRDGDYGTKFGNKRFLNHFLHAELSNLESEVEVYVFEGTSDGIEHFVETTGVTAENRLSPQEKEEIEQEERSLPDINAMNAATSGLKSLMDYKASFDAMKLNMPEISALKASMPNLDAMYSLKSYADAMKLNMPEISAMKATMSGLKSFMDYKAAIDSIKLNQPDINAMKTTMQSEDTPQGEPKPDPSYGTTETPPNLDPQKTDQPPPTEQDG